MWVPNGRYITGQNYVKAKYQNITLLSLRSFAIRTSQQLQSVATTGQYFYHPVWSPHAGIQLARGLRVFDNNDQVIEFKRARRGSLLVDPPILASLIAC